MEVYSRATVARHNREGDAWFIFKDRVFDLHRLIRSHPNERGTLWKFAGKDVDDESLDQRIDDLDLFEIGFVPYPDPPDPPVDWRMRVCLFLIALGHTCALVLGAVAASRCCLDQFSVVGVFGILPAVYSSLVCACVGFALVLVYVIFLRSCKLYLVPFVGGMLVAVLAGLVLACSVPFLQSLLRTWSTLSQSGKKIVEDTTMCCGWSPASCQDRASCSYVIETFYWQIFSLLIAGTVIDVVISIGVLVYLACVDKRFQCC